MYEPLIPARPILNEHGVAQHPDYGDVYHSLSGALGQTDYVFLGGNDLPARWQGRAQFTICETGFGLGNNFLATWHRWRNDPKRSQRLHFVSFEAHPLSRADLQRQLARSARQLQPLAQALLAAWPALLPGLHRLEFEQGQLSLTLIFGRIERTARQVEVRADAFFLDGFSPRLNPDMWTASLFRQLVRMAAPGATLATWCTASAVRQDLQRAGFLLQKRPGFGYKREMLQGQLRPHLGRTYACSRTPARVGVIGGGITAAALSQALARRGIRVHVFDPGFVHGPGAAHRGHSAVALRPLLDRDDSPRARLSRLGISMARQQWAPFLDSAWFLAPALQVACDPETGKYWQDTLSKLGFDPDWVQWQSAEAAQQFFGARAPYGGLHFKQAYVARPEALIKALFDHELISLHPFRIEALQQRPGQGWILSGAPDAEPWPHVVLANAQGARSLLQTLEEPPAYERLAQAGVVYGQVGNYEADRQDWPGDKILSGVGYALNDRRGHLVLGSSYERKAPEAWSGQVQRAIEDKLRPFIPAATLNQPARGGWVGARFAMRDHRPIVDQLLVGDTGLWLATAMGSYGFSWACAAAGQIAAQMSQEPHIFTLDLQRAVALR